MAYRSIPLIQQFVANRAARARQEADWKAREKMAASNMWRQMLTNLASSATKLGMGYVADEYFSTPKARRETLAGQLAAAEAARDASRFSLQQQQKAADIQREQALQRFEEYKPGLMQPTVEEQTQLMGPPGLNVLGGLAQEKSVPVGPGVGMPGLGVDLKRPSGVPPVGVPSDFQLRRDHRITGEARPKITPIAEVPPLETKRQAATRRAELPARRVLGPERYKGALLPSKEGKLESEFGKKVDALQAGVDSVDKTITKVVNKLPARYEKMTDNQKAAYVANRISKADRRNAAVKSALYGAQVLRADINRNVPPDQQDDVLAYLGESLGLAKEMERFKLNLKMSARGGRGKRPPKSDYDPKFKFSTNKEMDNRMHAQNTLTPFVSLPIKGKDGKVSWTPPMPLQKAWKLGTQAQALIQAGDAMAVKGSKRTPVNIYSKETTDRRNLNDQTRQRQESRQAWREEYDAAQAVVEANAYMNKSQRDAYLKGKLATLKARLRDAVNSRQQQRVSQLRQGIAFITAQSALGRATSAAQVKAYQQQLMEVRPADALPEFQAEPSAPVEEKSLYQQGADFLKGLVTPSTSKPAIQGEEALRKELFNQALKAFPGQGDAARRAKYVKARMDGKTDKQATAEASK